MLELVLPILKNQSLISLEQTQKKKKKSDNEITSPLIVKQKVPPIFLYDLCFQSFMLCYQYHLPPHVYQIGKSQEKNNNNKKGI